MQVSKKRTVLSKTGEIIFLVLFGILNLIPIFWGVLTSIKTGPDISSMPPKIFNFTPTFEHYIQVLKTGFLPALIHSAMYCVLSISLTLICAYLAGYGFARRRFPLKKVLFYIVILGIPLSGGSATLLIPNYMTMIRLNMVNKWYTMPIIFTAYHLPQAIWLMIAGIKSIPVELEEAAKIDGVGQGYIVSRLLPPLMLPSFAAVSLLGFIGSWNDYITSSVMVSRADLKTVQQVIYDYMGFYGREWGPLTAASTLAIIPIIIVFTFFGRQLVSGLTAGAVKG